MSELVLGLDRVLGILQAGLFWVAGALAVGAGTDWLVRTRRINPFSGVARWFRTSVEPLMLPVERRLVAAGGSASQTPWWTLVALVLGGIVVISLLEFVRDQLAMLVMATRTGGGGLVRLAIAWAFAAFRFALLWRVISTWVGGSPYQRLWRWAYVITEPVLRPIRAVLPAVGPFDVSPIVAWFVLGLLQGFLGV